MSFFLCFLFVVSLKAIGRAEILPRGPAPPLPKAITKFAGQFYDETSHDHTGDVIISPFSVFNAMCLLSQGANGDTYQELVNSLDIDDDRTVVANQIQSYYQSLQKSAGSTTMSVVNQMYVQLGIRLNQTFQNVAIDKFNSGVKTLNFTDAVNSAQAINAFVQGRTNNKIMDVVSSSMFDATTRLVLVNAVYFKGQWKRAFDPQKTTQGQFYFNAGGSGAINFMNSMDTFNYANFGYASALELPYANSNFSFFIVLPNEQTGFEALRDQLSFIDWTTIVDKMSPHKVNATIPKFKAHLQISLNQILKNVAIRKIFSESADLNGMLTSKVPLKVSEVHHSSSIDVDELGAEAASATSITIHTRSLPMPPADPPIQFLANHPFVFFILDKTERVIIFNGQLKNPVTE